MVGSLYDSLSFIFPPQTGDISKFGLLKSCSKCPFPALNSHPHPHVLFWTKGTSFHDFPHVSPLFVEFSAFVGGFSMGFPMVSHGFPWFPMVFPWFSHVFPIGGLEESELFTDFTESAFYSPEGLEATAPVFDKAPELPSPLGQVLVPW